MSDVPPSRDPRNIDCVPRETAYRRYRQQRMACLGFNVLFVLTRSIIHKARWKRGDEDLDAIAYELMNELARRGALDLVGLGEEESLRKEREEKEQRRGKAKR